MQRTTRMAFAAVLLLDWSTIVFAQSSPTTRSERRLGERWSSSHSANEPQRLFVVIEASAGKKSTDISQIVRLGLEHLKKERKFDFEDVRVQPVAGSLYRGMKGLFRGEILEPNAEEPGVSSAGNGLSMRLLPGGASKWEIGTGGPFIRAKSITVYFERDEDGKVITLSPPMTYPTAPVAQVDQPFRFHSPGTYIFSLEGETVPSRCEIELISSVAGETKSEIVKIDWPQENLYYLLLIDKFVGDRRVLFETLKNNRVVGNGLKEVQTVESATISLASFIDPVDTGTSIWDDERHYHVRIKKPDDKFPKRAWLLFPLDAETAKSELTRIKAVCAQGAGDRQHILETIRGSGVIASDKSAVKADAPPAWYEIPAESKAGSSFARVLEIAVDPSTPITAGPAFGLTIFEFNEEVILSVGNTYVQQNEHPRWCDGLQKLVSVVSKSR